MSDLAAFYSDRAVCVTGGAGFIGSHLVEALLEHGARVTVLDDLSSGRLENLTAVRGRDRMELVEGSILDDAALASAIQPNAIVFHEAALTSVPRSVEQPLASFEVNALGTARVLEAARRKQAARVIYASSSSVYGDQARSPKIESMEPAPRSPYAAAKLTGESMLQVYASCYGLSCVTLRYFNIFGPGQRPDSAYAAVIPRFICALQHNDKLTIFGDGRQTRDFTYVANAVHANLLAGATQREMKGEPINVACGEARSIAELVQALARETEKAAAIDHAPARAGEVEHSRADISRARAWLGYAPIVSFDEGLRRTVQALGSP